MERLGPLIGTLLLLTALLAHADAGATSDAPAQSFSRHIVKTSVNGELSEISVWMLGGGDGRVYLRAIDLLALGVALPKDKGVRVQGYRFVPADALDGVSVRADLRRARLWLRTQPADDALPPIVKERESIPSGDTSYREVAVRLVLDQRDTGRELTLLRQHDRWLIASDDLQALGLPLPKLKPLTVAGRDYLALDNLWPYRIDIDTTWKLLSVNRTQDTPKEGLRETWVEVNVNESRQPQLARALTDREQQYYLSADTFERFKLRTPERAVEEGDEFFYPVGELSGVLPVFNPNRQSLGLYAGAGAFQPSRFDGREFDYVEPDFDQRGGLLNYSLFASSTDERDLVSGQTEVGVFWGRGFLSSQHLHRDLAGAERDSVRLESSLRIDWPEQMRTLTLGDTLNEAGAWGRPVRFGGLRWGRNFSTQPGFVTFPSLVVAGEAEVPSTIDIFVNNARRAREDVQPGPFTVTDVPVVTGAGEMQIVTRDLLGRETVITRPFYASSRLLKPGLHEYSIEAGALRRDFTRHSNEYGDGFISGTHRYGFSDWFTGEVRGETTGDENTLGFGASLVWSSVAEFDMAVAASRDADDRSGELVEFGVRRQASGLSFGLGGTWRSREFAQLGDAGEVPDALEARAFAGFSLGDAGSFTVSHIKRNRREQADTEFATLQYSVSLWRSAHLRLSYLEGLSDDLASSATLSISVPLGSRTSGQFSTRRQNGQFTTRAQLQRNLPAGRGLGYRVSAESGELDRYEAGVSLRGNAGLATLQAGQLDDAREYRASLDGGVALMGGRPYLTRRLDRGFAVVEVPGMADVGIYHDNQLLATTGANGTAVIPGLRDYQENRIRIEDAALPLDVEVASLERTAVPAYRHGVALTFGIERARWVGFTVKDGAGTPLPVGAQLLNIASGERTVVGNDGRSYMELDPGQHEFRVWWRDSHCRFRLGVPKGEDVMPDLGVQVCE